MSKPRMRATSCAQLLGKSRFWKNSATATERLPRSAESKAEKGALLCRTIKRIK